MVQSSDSCFRGVPRPEEEKHRSKEDQESEETCWIGTKQLNNNVNKNDFVVLQFYEKSLGLF